MADVSYYLCLGKITNIATNSYLEVPFEDSTQAEIAVKVLEPDPILRPEDFEVDYSSKDRNLCISFKSIDDRVLRVGVSSVIESIKSIIETIDEFK